MPIEAEVQYQKDLKEMAKYYNCKTTDERDAKTAIKDSYPQRNNFCR